MIKSKKSKGKIPLITTPIVRWKTRINIPINNNKNMTIQIASVMHSVLSPYTAKWVICFASAVAYEKYEIMGCFVLDLFLFDKRKPAPVNHRGRGCFASDIIDLTFDKLAVPANIQKR